MFNILKTICLTLYIALLCGLPSNNHVFMLYSPGYCSLVKFASSFFSTDFILYWCIYITTLQLSWKIRVLVGPQKLALTFFEYFQMTSRNRSGITDIRLICIYDHKIYYSLFNSLGQFQNSHWIVPSCNPMLHLKMQSCDKLACNKLCQ